MRESWMGNTRVSAHLLHGRYFKRCHEYRLIERYHERAQHIASTQNQTTKIKEEDDDDEALSYSGIKLKPAAAITTTTTACMGK